MARCRQRRVVHSTVGSQGPEAYDGRRTEIGAAISRIHSGLAIPRAITNQGTVWMWNPVTGEPMLIVVEATEGCSVEAIAWHGNGRWLLAGGVDFLSTSGSTGFVCVWDVPEKKRLVTIPHGATCLAFDRECRRFAYSGPDGWIGIHQTDDGEPPRRHRQPRRPAHHCALVFTDDGNHIIAGGGDGLIRVSCIDSEELLTVRQFRSPIDDLLIRPDGVLLVAYQNGTVSELPVQRLMEDQ